MTGRGGNGRSRRPLLKRWVAIVIVVLAVASVVAGIWVYAPHQPSGVDPVRLQWSASLTDKALGGIRLHSAQFRTALDWDMRALIPGYVVSLLLAGYLGRRVFWIPRSREWALRGMVTAVLAGAGNIAQDLLLLKALGGGLRKGALLDWAEALSFVKFAALLVAGTVGVVAVMVTIGRLAMSNRTRNHWGNLVRKCGPVERLVIPPPVIENPAQDGSAAASRCLAGQDWWDGISTGPHARWAQGFASPSSRAENAVGVCVSGGGIRSATVTLGALRALREKDVLGDAAYLVSVSGGGYTVGGLQLAMTGAADGLLPPGQVPVSKAKARDAFAPGSPEEDHLRRHSSYIADGLGQWLAALAVLLRGVLSSLVVIGLTITTLGLAIGEFYVLPNSMIQLILLWICLAFLIVVSLLLCGWVATSALVNSAWALVPVAVLAVLTVIVDQTSMSLHPFYRLHLARAFAVRRVRRDHADVAVPYRDDEMTWLDTYAKPESGFPAVTFAATANISGQDRTPPGRQAVPFMLAHDYIGGPATGWVRTEFLRKLLPRTLREDLTAEAAVAISGAAFASAMGSQTRFYEVFLAIANTRLGAWLPNPYFVALKCANLDDWTIPGFPARRRLSYFAREIFAIHPSTGRLLLCTDGGHYDNLGLVELLRRRCKLIYCIDASGASQPLADALAGAITLAREELGIEITLTDQVYDLVPGGRQQLKPAESFTNLNTRLSKNQVAIGSIRYPEVSQRSERQSGASSRGKDVGSYPATTGQLVFAQAVLTPDMPYQLLDFPQADTGFPHDSTGDQFFNAGQFDAYQTLGYFLGQKAALLSADGLGKHPLPQPPRRSRLRRQFRIIRLRYAQRHR